jgi:PleD family two-component response regulator
MIQRLPVEASGRDWIALIENSVQMGRLLNRFHERINHLQQISTTDALTGLYNRATCSACSRRSTSAISAPALRSRAS